MPLNPRSGTAELAHIVARRRSRNAVLTAAGTEPPPALAAARRVAVELDHDATAGAEDDRASPRPGPDEPALIVYTSGTTGPPKGAVMPRRAIATNLDALAEIWEWTERDVVAHALPLFHVHGLVIGILGPLRRGGRALHLGRFDPAAVGAALSGDATMLFGVPTMYRRLAEAAEADPGLAAALARARVLVSGSAALPAAEHARLTRLTGRPVLERYGMTETLMNTGIRVGARAAPGTVGPPLPGRRAAAGRRRRQRAARRRTTRRSARSRSAVPTCSSATSIARTRPPRHSPRTAGSSPATWRPAAPAATSGWSAAARPT